ncbi:hypothetical protein BJ508DRAFT_415891 [Ascobolus immersus RN42]|uniref:Nephrocystin 3-like N-terminal domain-containing protein n=1 Tax=Ascobolus immersus RN42 TaxID=1160509 RepID=A0A3N4I609_ASCIM|nr:hypothetical protein BJ508DRAFT_415891 [Ascobolus immersus RN42]
MSVVGEIASIIACYQLGERLISLLIPYTLGVLGARSDIEQFQKELGHLKSALQCVERMGLSSAELDNILKTCFEDLKRVETKLEPRKKRSIAKISTRLTYPFKSGEVLNCVAALGRYTSTIQLLITGAERIEEDVRRLPFASNALYLDESWQNVSRCLAGTRVELLEEITTWGNSKAKDVPSIFWLCGMAGTGKSTIALTLAEKFDREGKLSASFFFRRNGGDQGNAKKFITTISKQLTSWSRHFKNLVGDALTKDPNMVQRGLKDQWKSLILNPLEKLPDRKPDIPIIFIVIDALDECEGEADVQTLLELLPQLAGLSTVRVRILITSRPEVSIKTGFRSVSVEKHKDFSLHDIEKDTVDQDIYNYLEFELKKVKADGAMVRIPDDWPDDVSLTRLVERASRLFIYAATVCRFVASYTKQYVANDQRSSPHHTLDQIYTQILDCSIGGEGGHVYATFKKTVGPIVMVMDTIGFKSLSRLLELDEQIFLSVVENLGSLLDTSDLHLSVDNDKQIQLLHPSFRDFLTDAGRCKESFRIDKAETHNQLLIGCLRTMRKQLQKNICSLQNPVTTASSVSQDEVKKRLSSELQYACKYWFEHLLRGRVLMADNGPVHKFLRNHLLKWLEALSLSGSDKLAEGIRGLVRIELDGNFKKGADSKLKRIIHDSKRFVWYFRPCIESWPLQLYSSAMLFSPSASIVKEHFSDEHLEGWTLQKPVVSGGWSSEMLTMPFDQRSTIQSLQYAPDGKSLAAITTKDCCRILDTTTGTEIHNLQVNVSPDLSCWIRFFPDGKQLAISSCKTMEIWDLLKGKRVHELKSEEFFSGISISPDGKHIAYADWKGLVRYWDTTTGEVSEDFGPVGDKAKPEDAIHYNLAFSDQGKLLAITNCYAHLDIWDTESEEKIHELKIDNVPVSKRPSTLSFSSDGKKVTAVSSFGRLVIWDASTGEELRQLDYINNEYDMTETITISHDFRRLAFNIRYDEQFKSERIRLFDLEAGNTYRSLGGNVSLVTDLAFSPDGRALASEHKGGMVRIWDLLVPSDEGGEAWQSTNYLAATSGKVVNCEFLLDGKWAFRYCENVDPTTERISIWNTVSGLRSGRNMSAWFISQDEAGILSKRFLDDGNLLEVTTKDGILRVWNIKKDREDTKVNLRTLASPVQEGCASFKAIVAVEVSSDRRLIALASSDETISVCSRYHSVERKSESLFTTNLTSLASQKTPEQETRPPKPAPRKFSCHFYFSHNGRYLSLIRQVAVRWSIAGFEVFVWNLETKALLHKTEHLNTACAFATFSPAAETDTTFTTVDTNGQVTTWHIDSTNVHLQNSSSIPDWNSIKPTTTIGLASVSSFRSTMDFSYNDGFLHLDSRPGMKYAISLREPKGSSNMIQEMPGPTGLHNGWILQNGKPVIWLPDDYKPIEYKDFECMPTLLPARAVGVNWVTVVPKAQVPYRIEFSGEMSI